VKSRRATRPTFEFAIARVGPNSAHIVQTIEMNTIAVIVNDQNSTAVMIYGASNLL
jgi:hypothetical protein